MRPRQLLALAALPLSALHLRPWALGPAARPCRCGHPSTAHEHLRRGTDCGLCRCQRLRSPAGAPGA